MLTEDIEVSSRLLRLGNPYDEGDEQHICFQERREITEESDPEVLMEADRSMRFIFGDLTAGDEDSLPPVGMLPVEELAPEAIRDGGGSLFTGTSFSVPDEKDIFKEDSSFYSTGFNADDYKWVDPDKDKDLATVSEETSKSRYKEMVKARAA